MIAATLLLVWQAVHTTPPARAGFDSGAQQVEAQVQQQAQEPVQIGVGVRPDTVTVGEHFLMTVRVRAPKGAEIGFPVGPDSGAAVDAGDP